MSPEKIVTGIGLCLVFACAGWAQGDAKDTYLDKCSVCHGADGTAKTAKGRKLKMSDVHQTVSKQSEAEMIAKCGVWYREDVARLVAPAALVAIAHHRALGHKIVLATGSTVYAARPVAAGVAIDHVLATELEVDAAGSFTGKPRALCFGRHKVTLVEEWAKREGIDLAKSYFYSDSYNDLPMLERVGTAIAVNPDARLRRHARKNGWQTQHWS